MDDELPDTACDFVHARGARFNEGVMGWLVGEMGRWSSKGQGRDLMYYTVLPVLNCVMYLFMYVYVVPGRNRLCQIKLV